MTTTTHDVLVVGAGPSGLTTALAATRNGARVLLVDRHKGTSVFPKATGIRPRSMEILRSWGLEEQVRAGAQDTRLLGVASASLVDPCQREVPLGAPSDEALSRLSPTTFAISPQDHLEPVLLDQLLELGAEVRFHTVLEALVGDADGVTALIRPADNETTYAVRARYVVGADGAESTVRRLAGIGVRHLGSEGEHLAMLFRADLAAHLAGRQYALHMVTKPGVEGVFVPSGQGRWMYDREWHPERGETLLNWPVSRRIDTIRRASGVPDLDVDLLGIFPWSFGAAVADRIRDHRIFLVGDAAHRTTPRGATGMNTGIADGHNLGWKLAWVCRGWADPLLLDTYAEERYPIGVHNALSSLSPAAERTDDQQQDFGPDPETALVGARAPHAWVQHHGRVVSTVDLFDGRLTLITGADGTGWRSALAGPAEGGMPVTALTVGTDLLDPSGELTDRYQLGRSDAVLVRPDGHVAARLADPARDLYPALLAALGRQPQKGRQP